MNSLSIVRLWWIAGVDILRDGDYEQRFAGPTGLEGVSIRVHHGQVKTLSFLPYGCYIYTLTRRPTLSAHGRLEYHAKVTLEDGPQFGRLDLEADYDSSSRAFVCHGRLSEPPPDYCLVTEHFRAKRT